MALIVKLLAPQSFGPKVADLSATIIARLAGAGVPAQDAFLKSGVVHSLLMLLLVGSGKVGSRSNDHVCPLTGIRIRNLPPTRWLRYRTTV